ncbi:MAG: tetratricopeptide repeat protein [Candidatus Melainabacteria bacterium]|nr:tetratricopeptide repeat protein [Candidatus Melainabacteria bacterium]
MTSFNPARAEVDKLIEIAKAHSAGKKRDAHMKWRAAAERSRELLGHTHEATRFCQNNVGKSLVEIGNHEEAIALLEAALRQTQAINGYVDRAVEHIHQSLARAHKALGDHATAYKHWMAAATSSQTLRGANHTTTSFCFHQAARALASQKLFEQALPLFQTVLAANVARHGDSVNTAFALRDTATCLNQLERYEEAKPLWKRAYRLFSRVSDKKDIANSALRCLNWTSSEVRARRHAEQLRVLANIKEMSDTDKDYLIDLSLTNKQLNAVLIYLTSTYLKGDLGEYQYVDNLRVAVKSRTKQVAAYTNRAGGGCCGSEDVEIRVVEDDEKKETILVGFNFGH